ncbi:hypothetical protein NDU88_001264 [Pleurodeles waltl]|uniref:Uncharacterized protein n=1 Tax=Pleurodeles waltl TaxID=8319 RepID=A0AAV7MS91_PLEWA|nr:hypothetical protein NDU88_001264 [Pleurodeles waltl]
MKVGSRRVERSAVVKREAATEEWGAAALEDRSATTDGTPKEKKSWTSERTSRRPRRCNANLPATLQEKRGNHRCVPGTNKGAQGG